MARKRRKSKNSIGTWLILAAGVFLLTRKRTSTDTAGIDPMDVPVKTGPVVAVGKKRPPLRSDKKYL